MIAKAMSWIKEHTAPNIVDIDGAQWADKPMHKIQNIMDLEKVELYTLTSLVEYMRSGIDVPNEFIGHVFINVMAPSRVLVYSDARKGNHYARTVIADVSAILPAVKVGAWVDQTEFCIMMRANFIDGGHADDDDTILLPDTDKDALIKVASNIISGSISQYEDTGISQKATLKTGIQEQEDKLLPEKVVLRPYRTFLEVEQPKSEFLFRAQDDKYNGVQLSLHEADGGRWRLDAMAAVKGYLVDQLADLPYIKVIA